MAEPKFEKDLERLESIVGALEEGGLSLDESLKRFEEGIKLWRRCEKALSEAEKKIEVLVENASGEIGAQPFGDEEEDGAEAGSAGGAASVDDEDDDDDGEDQEELPF